MGQFEEPVNVPPQKYAVVQIVASTLGNRNHMSGFQGILRRTSGYRALNRTSP